MGLLVVHETHCELFTLSPISYKRISKSVSLEPYLKPLKTVSILLADIELFTPRITLPAIAMDASTLALALQESLSHDAQMPTQMHYTWHEIQAHTNERAFILYGIDNNVLDASLVPFEPYETITSVSTLAYGLYIAQLRSEAEPTGYRCHIWVQEDFYVALVWDAQTLRFARQKHYDETTFEEEIARIFAHITYRFRKKRVTLTYASPTLSPAIEELLHLHALAYTYTQLPQGADTATYSALLENIRAIPKEFDIMPLRWYQAQRARAWHKALNNFLVVAVVMLLGWSLWSLSALGEAQKEHTQVDNAYQKELNTLQLYDDIPLRRYHTWLMHSQSQSTTEVARAMALIASLPPALSMQNIAWDATSGTLQMQFGAQVESFAQLHALHQKLLMLQKEWANTSTQWDQTLDTLHTRITLDVGMRR
ncbi:MAG: hypothetical protein KU37_05050 [Sulfuricurvum sp. PC08-66]|nr:MAG: hypothetical protein KU37_05050 [Sulfuricurvum sp. PC08-66]